MTTSRSRGVPPFEWVPLLCAAIVCAAAPRAQTSPEGFGASVTFADTTQVPFVRRVFAISDKDHLVAVRHELHRTGASLPPAGTPPVLAFDATDDVAFLADAGTPAPAVFVGALRKPRIVRLDLTTDTWVDHADGVANTFDAVAVGNGDLLASANPLWPQSGASSGVWLVGPGRVPREILALQGPSGPLVLLANGDLVVAELGFVVPPPPGAAHLLRIPAAKVQLAIAGATLTSADVVASGAGFVGIYDLAEDDMARLYVSDPASGVVQHTAPGGLSPVAPFVDVGPARFVTSLQLARPAGTTFRAFQPPHAGAALVVAASDYTSNIDAVRVTPRRPELTIVPGPFVAPGASTLHVANAPTAGIALLLGSLVVNTPEYVALTLDGSPLWLGLPLGSTLVLDAQPLALGAASFAFANPGGFTARIDLQAVAFGALPGNHVGSSTVLPVQILP